MVIEVANIRPLNMSGTKQSPVIEVVRGSRARELTCEEREFTDTLFKIFEMHMLGTRACAKTSLKNAMGAVVRFFNHVGLPPWEWREYDVDEFLANKAVNANISARTQAQYITYLRAFQNRYIKDQGLINETRRRFGGRQPDFFVTDENAIPIKRKHCQRVREIQPLSPVQCQMLITQFDAEIRQVKLMGGKSYNPLRRDKTMIMLTLMTGVRVEELVNISMHSFSADRRYPQFGRFALLRVTGKGGKTRTIRLYNPMIKPLMEWYINDVRPSFLSKATDDPNLLFLSERGVKVCTEQVRRTLAKIASHASITIRVSPHLLRHTYATEMKDIISAEALKEQLGHEHLSTTLSTYYHPDPEKVGDQVRVGIDKFTQAINAKTRGILDESKN